MLASNLGLIFNLVNLQISITKIKVIDPDNDDLINAVMELTLGKGVDYAFDAVGNSELIALGLTVSKTGGSTVIISVAGPPDTSLAEAFGIPQVFI